MDRILRSFYEDSALEVARSLLGKYIVLNKKDNMYITKIVETEAYIGAVDKAAHSYQNKRTPRTEVMFGPPGHAYVYLIYGMYNCLNIVAQRTEEAAAVLIRGVEPIEGIEAMAMNRYNRRLEELNKRQIFGLTNGPGKLCKAMDITREDNGRDLCSKEFYIATGNQEDFDVVTTKRINIDYAEEAIDFPWRFYIKDNPYVSKIDKEAEEQNHFTPIT